MSYNVETVTRKVPCTIFPYLQEIEKQITVILDKKLLSDLIQIIVQYAETIKCHFTTLEPADMHSFMSMQMQGEPVEYDDSTTFTWSGEWLTGSITQETRRNTCLELETIIWVQLHWVGPPKIPLAWNANFEIDDCESMIDNKVAKRIQNALLLPTTPTPATLETTIEWKHVLDILVANY
jgi:hypothetical protein